MRMPATDRPGIFFFASTLRYPCALTLKDGERPKAALGSVIRSGRLVMRACLWLLGAAFMLVSPGLSTSALAQSVPEQTQLRQARLVWQMSDCLVQHDEDMANRMLSRQSVVDGQFTRAQQKYYSRIPSRKMMQCLESGMTTNFSYDYLASGVAAASVRQFYAASGKPVAAQGATRIFPEPAAISENASQNASNIFKRSVLLSLGECIWRKNAADSLKLLGPDPADMQVSEALESLKPAVNACFPESQSGKLVISLITLREFIAYAAYFNTMGPQDKEG